MPLLQELMLYLKTRGNEDFFESMIAYFGAPVMAGLKCASLINLTRGGRPILEDWLKLKERLSSSFNVNIADISVSERSVLILVYRPQELLAALSADGAREFLISLGYDGDFESTEPYITRLSEAFSRSIPHEVGIFLGYPLEDVRGFIENEGRNAKLTGYWKVYGNELYALSKFEEYRRAETNYAAVLLGRTQNLVEAV